MFITIILIINNYLLILSKNLPSVTLHVPSQVPLSLLSIPPSRFLQIFPSPYTNKQLAPLCIRVSAPNFHGLCLFIFMLSPHVLSAEQLPNPPFVCPCPNADTPACATPCQLCCASICFLQTSRLSFSLG